MKKISASDITLKVVTEQDLSLTFREKLSTYRDYVILGDNGFKSSFRSLIISKNR